MSLSLKISGTGGHEWQMVYPQFSEVPASGDERENAARSQARLSTTLPPVTTPQSPTFVHPALFLCLWRPHLATLCSASCVYKPQESKNSTLHSSAYGRLLGILSDRALITNRKFLLNTFPFGGITSKQDIDVKHFAEIPSM